MTDVETPDPDPVTRLVVSELSNQLQQAILDRAVWRARALAAEAALAELDKSGAQPDEEDVLT